MIELRKFALAGNAIFTVTSRQTQKRFTFRVQKPKESNKPHFVGVLTGSDNTHDYTPLAHIVNSTELRFNRNSRISSTAPSAQALAWLWRNIDTPVLKEKAEVHHEGRCGRCGRVLSVPTSVESGIGPECAKFV